MQGRDRKTFGADALADAGPSLDTLREGLFEANRNGRSGPDQGKLEPVREYAAPGSAALML